MKRVAATIALMLGSAAMAQDGPRFAESCSGSEVVQVGSQPPRTVPYTLDFSVDLATRSYCYGPCGAQQSYDIADPASTPLKLADVDKGSQIRHLVFDRATGQLVDAQSMDLGMLGKVTRQASATCKPGTFHEPGKP